MYHLYFNPEACNISIEPTENSITDKPVSIDESNYMSQLAITHDLKPLTITVEDVPIALIDFTLFTEDVINCIKKQIDSYS